MKEERADYAIEANGYAGRKRLFFPASSVQFDLKRNFTLGSFHISAAAGRERPV